jgi:hypothetical protein
VCLLFAIWLGIDRFNDSLRFRTTISPYFSAYARFHRNLLDGPINPIFANFQLNELWLQDQPLKGTIPSELGKLSDYLFDLRLHRTEIEGTIPNEIFDLKDLWRLDLHSANLTGTLNTLVGELQALEVLRLADNRFTGQLPTELASLSQLKTLWVDTNDFEGSVPSGLCFLQGTEGLEDLSADCLTDPVTGETEVACECCTLCCGGSDGRCQ